MEAKPVKAIVVLEFQTLPDGVRVLIVPCSGYDMTTTLPKVVECDGIMYGYTGWNSDRNIAYYRDDAMIAYETTFKQVNAFGS